MSKLEDLWRQGYAAVDIVTTLFRVVKGMDAIAEYTKLEFIKVRLSFRRAGRAELMRESRRLGSRTCASSRA